MEFLAKLRDPHAVPCAIPLMIGATIGFIIGWLVLKFLDRDK